MHSPHTRKIPEGPASLKYWMVGFALLAVFASASSYAASASGFAGTCVSAPAEDADWINPGNAEGAPDDLPATVILTNPSAAYSDYLSCTDFGFAIPAGSRIDSITVTLRRSATIGGVMITANFGSLRAGSVQFGGGFWGVIFEDEAFVPSQYDPPWTAAEINDSGFGFRLRTSYFGGEANTLTASLDSMEVTIEYTPNEVFDDGFETP